MSDRQQLEHEVEMHSAWRWDCPECGVENFEHAMTVEMTNDEWREQLIRMGQLEEWEETPPFQGGVWQTYPNGVECRSCGCAFATTDPSRESGDDE